MYQPALLPFTSFNGQFTSLLERELDRPLTAQQVGRWAWMIGLWVTCGSVQGQRLILQLPQRIINGAGDARFCQQIIQEWRDSLQETTSSTPPPVLDSSSASPDSDVQLTGSAPHPLEVGGVDGEFGRVLTPLGLFPESKSLPWSLLTETPAIRTQLLGGIIEGGVSRITKQGGMKLRAEASSFLEQVAHLAGGLGFQAGDCVEKQHKQPPLSLTLHGEHLSTLPLSIPCKRLLRLLSLGPTSRDSTGRSPRCHGFTVQAAGVGDYFGFEVDGNKRFLLDDFVVTHNVR
jgi:hypothetical protein